jgi:N-acetylglucosaminyl-diphospho-decaprenol L-rhamnosyltransferase
MAAFPAAVRCRPARHTGRFTATTPLVSVVIVNYRRWEETAALVDQLVGPAHIYRDRIEVIVIDNASPNDPREDWLRGNNRVTFRRLPENRGFGAGVNAGVRLAQAPWVLVLNPDVILCAGFVDLLCAAALDIGEDASQGRPVGVVGFQLRNRDGSRQLSTGLFPTLSRMVLGLLRPRQTRKYIIPTAPDRQRVPWVTGSCMLIRSACFAEVNGFDEDYFLYYEDVDLCRRAEAKGWAVCYDPALEAVHLDPLQNRPLTATMRAVTRHASLVYFHKHLPGWQAQGLVRLIQFEAWVREGLARLRGRHDEAWVCQQVRRGGRDFLAGRFHAARQRLEAVLIRAGMRSG